MDTCEINLAEPMPYIGMYVVLASLVCTMTMAGDMIVSFTWKRLWIPSRFFVLNSAILTILGIATKIPNDVNTCMPGWMDQLAKLSGLLLICVSMSHGMPSLSVLDGGTLLSNLIALGILVISTTVNIGFQIHTGAIASRFSFLMGCTTLIMLFMYLILVSHSLTITAVREIQEKRYNSKHKELLGEAEGSVDCPIIPTEKLTMYVTKYWLMALTSSPDYILLSSGMCSTNITLQWLASFCFLCGVPFYYFRLCDGKYFLGSYYSDYKVSILFILIVQAAAASVGFFSSLMRLVQSSLHNFGNFESMPFIERYRLQKLREWRADPLPFHIESRGLSIVVIHAKDLALGLLMLFQRFMSALTRVYLFVTFYVILVVPFTLPLFVLHRLFLRRSSDEAEDEYLSGYVLTLEGGGEGNGAKATAKRWKNYPSRNWIQSGRHRSPRNLLDFLLTDNATHLLTRILRNGSVEATAPDGDASTPRRSWSLQVVTLGCVVKAAFGSSKSEILMKAIDEGFRYCLLVDENHVKVSEKAVSAAKMVRERLAVRGEWLDLRLESMAAGGGGRNVRHVLRDLEVWATGYVKKYGKVDYAEWSLEAIAARSMSRVTQAMLEWKIGFTFDELEAEVVGLLETCLRDLSLAIFHECSKGNYGSREGHVRSAALFLGETKEILELLEGRIRLTSPP